MPGKVALLITKVPRRKGLYLAIERSAEIVALARLVVPCGVLMDELRSAEVIHWVPGSCQPYCHWPSGCDGPMCDCWAKGFDAGWASARDNPGEPLRDESRD